MTTETRRRGRVSRWYHDRSLRSRLAILTAAAVAVAIALCSVACWFVLKDRLYTQVRQNLATATRKPSIFATPKGDFCRDNPVAAQAAAVANAAAHPVKPWLPGGGTQTGGGTAGKPPAPSVTDQASTQLVAPDGSSVCLLGDSTQGINIQPSDLSAVGYSPGQATYRSGSFVNGTPVEVRVVMVNDPNTGPVILLSAISLTSTEHSLRDLAFLLVAVAALGALGAGFTGRVVARAGLKPVHELSEMVEHIARTEEVGTTIPVHGNDEIARLASSFNSMSTALANSRDLQTRLIADAGHELRTPLTSLRTNVDLLIRSDQTGRPLPPATRAKLLGNMKAQMQELTLLIGDLLQLSKPDSPRPGQNVATVAMHEIAARAVERGKLRGPGLDFRVELQPWYVRADAAALERAVMNLLDNAVKYSPPGAPVEVRLRGGQLTVRDHGPGIPTEELQYVFDRFWRSPSSRQLPGSGLGLSIVAQTVEASGGQVSLGPAGDGGPGALATMRLPGTPETPPAPPPLPEGHPAI
ncbi:sensor histidine kinase [Kitasatospora sp. NPDC052896]|uniref:sensor histidine kinase n=1 Tax=Kitasatospora sp. NPDC052896 TaxID=3364061 RepID=UPI0037CC2625